MTSSIYGKICKHKKLSHCDCCDQIKCLECNKTWGGHTFLPQPYPIYIYPQPRPIYTPVVYPTITWGSNTSSNPQLTSGS